MSIDEIEREFRGRYIVPIPRGTGVWACVNSRKWSKVIVGLGAPSTGVMAGLHEAMHALSNPQGVPRILMLSEGGAEFYARQAARARGITYQKVYDDQEAIFGKLVTDLGDQPVADAFFRNGLSKFEEAFTKTYGAGRLQQLIDLPSSALLSASKLVNLDYETMTNGRP